jgi:hypothetical protein
MKYLLVALLLTPTFSFADDLHYDLDLGQIYRRSMERSDRETQERREEQREQERDRQIQELMREMNRPKTKFDDTGNTWREYPNGLVIPLEKGKK